MIQHISSKLVQFGERSLDLSTPRVMGILNVTPDSFFDGGKCFSEQNLDLSLALKRAEKMVEDGADFIDVGGESTRPGAASVGLEAELDRVLPVVEAICRELDVIVSVDTSSSTLMREAAALGAGFINDVRALQRQDAVEAVSDIGLPVCLMHIQGEPDSMQAAPRYNDVVPDVTQFLSSRADACIAKGIAQENIIVDPGFGFGKSDKHNLLLLQRLEVIKALGYPVLAGLSRKSMIGRLLAREPDRRLPGSLGFALVALQRGASILRVHDVAETKDIVNVFQVTQY